MDLLSDTQPDHENGLPDEAYNLATYDLPTFTPEVRGRGSVRDAPCRSVHNVP
jgi:hypothetical protein